MSEHIVHTAILEDSFNLALISEEVCEEFKDLIKAHGDFAHIGCVTISGDMFSFVLLEECRNKWHHRTAEDRLEAKLAFVLGWLTHRAADRQMKPLWRLGPIKALEQQIGLKPTDCSIYHEGFMLKEYYMKDSIYKDAIIRDELKKNPSLSLVDEENFSKLIHTLVKRSLIEMHTFKPDYDDINGWLEKIFDRQQRFYLDLDRYSKAALNPDENKYKTYITDINFYDREEPLLRLAKFLRTGEKADWQTLSLALKVQAESQYAQALVKSYNYIVAASNYFKSDMAIDSLINLLDIGKRGPDGIIV